MKKIRGKLIVIEGIDKSGKATQTRFLVRRLKKEGKRVASVSFPEYKSNLFGKLIKEALAGEHGDFLSLDPFIASTLYAADRYESKEKIEAWLSAGYTVVLDRYVSSNQIHQGGKIRNMRKRVAFLSWLEKVEYGIFRLPKPNITFYLRLPIAESLKLLAGARSGKSSKDKSESNMVYYKNSKTCAEWLSKRNKAWKTIDCMEEGTLLAPKVIHEKLYGALPRSL